MSQKLNILPSKKYNLYCFKTVYCCTVWYL